MAASNEEQEIFDVFEESILYLPTSQAATLNTSLNATTEHEHTLEIEIEIDDEAQTGEMIVNGTKLYGKMADMTCVYASVTGLRRKRFQVDSMTRVMVCREEPYADDSPPIGNYFSIQTELHPTKMLMKRKYPRLVPKLMVPDRVLPRSRRATANWFDSTIKGRSSRNKLKPAAKKRKKSNAPAPT